MKAAAWVALCLAAATCMPLDERSIVETGSGGAGGGKGGRGGSGGSSGSEAGATGEAGSDGSGGTSAGGAGGSGGKASGGNGASGGNTSGGTGGNGGAAGSTGGGPATGGDGGTAGDGGTGGNAGSSGAGTGGTAGAGGTGVPCDDPVEPGWDVDTEYLTGLSAPTDIAFHPDGRAVVITKPGTVIVRQTDGTTNELTGIFGTVDTGSEKGGLGVVADPTTPSRFLFYVSIGPNEDKHKIVSGTLDSSNSIAVDLANPIVAAGANGPGLEGPANHDGGSLIIHKNRLYIGVGDTGSNSTPPSNKYGSCLNKPNGKILRVNLDGSIPDDNPLASVGTVTGCDTTRGGWNMASPDRRIYAWGFRNPWRFWIDPVTDLMWIGDVGESTREEISVGGGNTHYGYPFVEGTTEYPDIESTNCNTNFVPARACTSPVYDYDSNGSSVTGGLIPSGCGWGNVWDGTTRYLFADWSEGWIKSLDVRSDHSGIVSSMPLTLETPGGGPVSFRMGPDESLYIVYHQAGAVYRYTPKSRCGDDCR
jgi:glucose/arabinose dehydrogenase